MHKFILLKKDPFQRILYTVLLLAAVILVLRRDVSAALICGGIGLAFDPFDSAVALGRRPWWQVVWLLAHLAAVIVLIFII